MDNPESLSPSLSRSSVFQPSFFYRHLNKEKITLLPEMNITLGVHGANCFREVTEPVSSEGS